MPSPHDFRDSACRAALLVSSFTFEDAASITTLGPFLAQVRRQESVRRSAYELEAARQVLSLRGCDMGPFVAKTDAEIKAEAEQLKASREAYAKAPQGRLLACLKELRELGCGAAADKVKSAMDRGFASLDRPASVGELANALLALNDLAGSDAREARAIIGELMLIEHRRAGAVKFAAE